MTSPDSLPLPQDPDACFSAADIRAANAVSDLTGKIASESGALRAYHDKEHVVQAEINSLLHEQEELRGVMKVADQLRDQAIDDDNMHARWDREKDDSEAAEAICVSNLHKLAREGQFLKDQAHHEDEKLHQLRHAREELKSRFDTQLVGFEDSLIERELATDVLE